MKLNIAIIGHERPYNELALDKIRKMEIENIRLHPGSKSLTTEKGHRYKCINGKFDLRGESFDQLVVFQDKHRRIGERQGELLHLTIENMENFSRIPEEFRIIDVEN